VGGDRLVGRRARRKEERGGRWRRVEQKGEGGVRAGRGGKEMPHGKGE